MNSRARRAEETRGPDGVARRASLAIEHAASFLDEETRISIDTASRSSKKTQLLPHAVPNEDAKQLKPIAATWRASLQRMRPASRTPPPDPF